MKDEENDEDLILEDSKDVLLKLKSQFEAIPDNALHDEAVKMMFADVKGREKVMEDLSKLDHVYKAWVQEIPWGLNPIQIQIYLQEWKSIICDGLRCVQRPGPQAPAPVSAARFCPSLLRRGQGAPDRDQAQV